jgi:hypothetical protein
MSPPPSARDHGRALVALGWIGFFLLMASPGLPLLKPGAWKRAKFQKRVRHKVGEPGVVLAVAASRINDLVRVPISSKLRRVERVFRIHQDWHLWGNGTRRVLHLEVLVDDVLVHRTNDPEHAWQRARFRHRRVRPMVEAVAMRNGAHNWKGLGRFIVREARADFPGCERVRIQSTERGSLEAPADERVIHGRVASAPDWTLEPLVITADVTPSPHDGPAAEAAP